MSVNLLTEHHLEFLRLKGGCTGPSESTLVKKPYCWKSRVTAQMSKTMIFFCGKGSLLRPRIICKKSFNIRVVMIENMGSKTLFLLFKI